MPYFTKPGLNTNQTNTVSNPTQNNTGKIGGGFLDDPEKLKKILGLYALAKGNVASAYDILKPDAETAESKNRKIALLPAQLAVQKAKLEKYEGTGPMAYPALFSMKYLGGSGVRENLIKQNQTFELLKQNVVRALQGARMSDTDMEMARTYIPSIGDTKKTIKIKLDNLDEFLKNMTTGNTTGGTGEVGTQTPEATGGMIRVRQKSSGKVGTIPAANFNSLLYDKI